MEQSPLLEELVRASDLFLIRKSDQSCIPSTMSQATIDREGTIEITPEKPTAVVLFAHGLGDTAHGWADTMATLSKDLAHIKFVLPTAAQRPVTVNGGRPMHAWYDIKSMDKSKDDSADGLEGSRDRLLALIEKEVAAGIPHSRIVLGGFSQGAAMSLVTGYRMKALLAGVICLSGFIPSSHTFSVSPETTSVPLLMCHGDSDRVVSLARGTQAKDKLEASGVNIDFRIYNGMGHSSSVQELRDIKKWLTRVLPASDDAYDQCSSTFSLK